MATTLPFSSVGGAARKGEDTAGRIPGSMTAANHKKSNVADAKKTETQNIAVELETNHNFGNNETPSYTSETAIFKAGRMWKK
jgi:hypothetical protein